MSRAASGEAAAPAAGPALPAGLTLGDGEVVLLAIKPSPLFIVLGALGHAAALAAIGVALWLLAQRWLPVPPRNVGLATGFALVARFAWQALDWAARDYVLTDRRVLRLAGVLRRRIFEASLRGVQHTEVYKSVVERVFGLGSLGIATAGTGAVEAWWITIDRPEQAARALREAVERYGGGPRTLP